MRSAEIPLNDPLPLGEGPARDSRFVVAERWIECVNFPPGHPERELEFFHRQMNEEMDSLECSARNLSDFPDSEWDLRLFLARQCADEARHAAMFRSMLESRGGHVGQYPVLNFQYRIICNIGSLAGRLAVQNRSFEAGGLDAINFGIEDARRRGDEGLLNLFEAQRADEISHVRFANEWIRAAAFKDPRNMLLIGSALSSASKAFFHVMGAEGTEGVSFPADVAGRREAGFTDGEVQLATRLGVR